MQSLHWTIPPILEGAHVSLEPLQPHHGEDLLAAAADGELWNLWYTQVPGPETLRAWLARAMADREAGTAMPFLVRDANGEPVGSTRFFRMDPVVPSLEIGFTWYSARVQRTALNTEAKRLLLGHAFDAMGCSVIELRTHVMNHRSRSAIERLGAHFDGILRRQMRMPDGHLRDTAVYSILDSEWPVVRRNLDFLLEHGGRHG
ncbi:MAG: GNAT family N-acetyltransferase [Arenimonas sp. SCN 70-307]|uniref:GNAT family N-acetyltransferase n=1 Tax=Arenimonas sp. SCN 70-307 TaxID=1660089 RepID=UPI00086C2CB4|nr:GNAT family N-acetyltransferase [Arenimonas sp. SCN 70-307]ODS64906.1 MAG: GNAT family N-acetyltransferase [Arenimonas sp. SCN 70-307]